MVTPKLQWASCPHEIIHEFLGYLDYRDIRNARITCKDWRDAASDDLLLRKLFLRTMPPHLLEENLGIGSRGLWQLCGRVHRAMEEGYCQIHVIPIPCVDQVGPTTILPNGNIACLQGGEAGAQVVTIHNPKQANQCSTQRIPEGLYARSLIALSSQMLAVGDSLGGTIHYIPIEPQKMCEGQALAAETPPFIQTNDPINSLSMLPSGEIAVLNGSTTLKIVNLQGVVEEIFSDPDAEYRLAVTNQGTLIFYDAWHQWAIVEKDKDVRAWNREHKVQILADGKDLPPIHSLCSLQEEEKLAILDNHGRISIWERTSGLRFPSCIHEGASEINALANPNILVSASNKDAKIWDLRAGACIMTIDGVSGMPRVATRGSRLVLVSHDRRSIKVVDFAPSDSPPAALPASESDAHNEGVLPRL